LIHLVARHEILRGNMWISALINSLVWSRGEFPVIKAALELAVAQYTVAISTYGRQYKE